MTHQTVYRAFDEAVIMPKIYQLSDNLFAASFFLMKLLPATYIIDTARRSGELHPGARVIETTSGTFGLALAILCNRYGYQCTLVSDPVLDPLLKNRIESLGATVDIVDTPSPTGGFQEARLARLKAHLNQDRSAFWPQQYTNPNNPRSYAALAEYLSTALGKVDCLVGTVGSGGSMCGTTRYLRTVNPSLKAVAVDTAQSILFGQPDGKRLVRGLGNSIMPDILDHTVFDEVHWLTADETFAATHAIHKDHGLFVGPTSGAAFQVARHWAAQNPTKTTVFICADEGYRYLDNVFDRNWLERMDLKLNEAPLAPCIVQSPKVELKHWSMMEWGRRTLGDVLLQAEPEQVP